MSDGSQPADLPLPENAIQAGFDAIRERWPQDHEEPIREDVILALTAAADDLRAQGAADERRRAVRIIREEAEWHDSNAESYQLSQTIALHLRDVADQIENGAHDER